MENSLTVWTSRILPSALQGRVAITTDEGTSTKPWTRLQETRFSPRDERSD